MPCPLNNRSFHHNENWRGEHHCQWGITGNKLAGEFEKCEKLSACHVRSFESQWVPLFQWRHFVHPRHINVTQSISSYHAPETSGKHRRWGWCNHAWQANQTFVQNEFESTAQTLQVLVEPIGGVHKRAKRKKENMCNALHFIWWAWWNKNNLLQQ